MNHKLWFMIYESKFNDFFLGFNNYVLEVDPFALVFVLIVTHDHNVPF